MALLNGSPTDNNATLFKQGYEKAITDAGYTVAADQCVPDWDNTKAGTIFEQMFTKANGDFVGVARPTTVSAARSHRCSSARARRKDIPTTGQDATDEGLQRVLLGTQCMTVYKAIKKEADAAAEAGDRAGQGRQGRRRRRRRRARWRTPRPSSKVKSVLLEPQAIFPENVKDVDRRRLHDRGQDLHDGGAQEGLRRERRQRMTRPPRDSSATLLSLRGINKSFGAVHVLRDVDLDVRAGEVTALVGDNGAGKSTLIKCVAGIHPFDDGEMIFEG